MRTLVALLVLFISPLAFSNKDQGLSTEHDEREENFYGNPGENYYEERSQIKDENANHQYEAEDENQKIYKADDYQS